MSRLVTKVQELGFLLWNFRDAMRRGAPFFSLVEFF
jgi:hypothetical protein